MPANSSFKDRVMELLAPIGEVSSRPMFGGFGIFHRDAMFALISKSALYFKVDGNSRARYEAGGSQQYRPMPYFEVPAAVFEEPPVLLEWARTAIATAHATPQKKSRPKGG